MNKINNKLQNLEVLELTNQINQKLLESYQAIGRSDLYRPF